MALTIISSGTATGGSYPERIAIYLGVEMISQDIANNRGTYRVRGWLVNNTTWTPYNTYPGDNAYYLRINGATIKSGYQFVDFRSSNTHVIADENITLNHDSNGNLSFVAETRQAIDGVSTFDYAWRQGTYNAPQIKRASKITAGAANIDAAIPVTITPEQTGVTHDIAVKFGAAVIKTIPNAGIPTTVTLTAAEWTTLYNLTKTATTFNLAIELTTKLSGATIGTNTAMAAITYPGTVVPTLTGVTVADLNATVAGVVGAGNYIQLLSELRISINGAAGAKGSTIAEYELIVNGTKYGAATHDYTPGISGPYAVTARVKDTRGRWSEQKPLSFSVAAYEKPKIDDYSVIRADAAGVADQLGTYSKHTGALLVKNLIIGGTEKNQLRYKIDKVINGEITNILTMQTAAGLSAAISHILGTYSIDTAHNFRITAYDKFDQSFVSDFLLPSARVPFALSKTGASIGGIFDNADPSVLQVFGSLNVKDSGKILYNGVEQKFDGPIIGNYQTGRQLMANGLLKQWKTYQTTVTAAEMAATGPTGMFKSGWKTPGNWPVAFSAVPRITGYTLTLNSATWAYMGTILTPTAAAAGDFFIFKHTATDSTITVFIEAIGPA